MKIVLLNGKRINYDNKIDFSILGEDLVVYEETKKEEILPRVEGADIVITKELVMDKETIMNLSSSVKMICEAGTGYNNIDLEACSSRGIVVTNIKDYSSKQVAVTTMMLILNLSFSMHRQLKMLNNKDYSNFYDNFNLPYNEVMGKTLGVIGTGNIGLKVIELAKSFGMNIVAYSRTKKDIDGVTYVTLDELLKMSDFVTVHLPLNDGSYHLLNEEKLSLMKKTAYIINTSRGAVIDEKVLIKKLKDGSIAGAALDVLENEPLSMDNELITLENVILTPHHAWKALETRQRLVELVGVNIDSFVNGKAVNVVNK